MMNSPRELPKNPGFVRELWQFLAQRKKWYLIPIAIGILLMGILVILGSTAAAPFIYTLF
jgi:hypothetical protein